MKYLVLLITAAALTACATASKDQNSTRFSVPDTTSASGLNHTPETEILTR